MKIGPIEVQVIYVDGLKNFGKFLEKKFTIKIRHDMEAGLHGETLMHESLHAMSAVYNLGLTEKQVASLSPALTLFLRDNPGTLADILETE